MSKLDAARKLLETLAAAVHLPTKAYHGTASKDAFRAFENRPVSEAHMLDRALGTHAAKDPALASSFPENWIGYDEKNLAQSGVIGRPRVYPVQIPDETSFLQAVQPKYPNRSSSEPLWRQVATDQFAIERMIAEKGYPMNPDMLARYLNEARAVEGRDAGRMASEMLKGGRVNLPVDGPHTFDSFIRNFGGKPYNLADKQELTDLARKGWEDEGYKGIRYINTGPTEMTNAKDPTSYIVFDPANIRSRFAQFDPRKMSSADLLASLTGLAGTGVAANVVRQQGQQ